MTPYQEFIPPPCGRDWNVSHSWANSYCIRSLTPLIDWPGQFISHCDSFLYSLGRQGKRRGMQIKSSRNIVHNTYCVLIARWTVTSRMFSTYLSICVWACLLFHMHVRLPSRFPQHADKPPNFWKITDFRVEVFEKKTRGNSSGSTIKWSEPRTMAWRPWTSAFIRLSLWSSAGTRLRKNIGRRQRKFSQTGPASADTVALCVVATESEQHVDGAASFFPWLVTFDFWCSFTSVDKPLYT